MKLSLTLAAGVLAVTATAAVADEIPGAHFLEGWDLDGNGTVSLAEATEQRGNVFAMFDENEDGVMDASEFATFDEHRAADAADNGGGKGEERMQQGMTLGFNDANKDGQVTLDEFIAGTAAWLDMIDRNGDGVVSQADFGKQ